MRRGNIMVLIESCKYPFELPRHLPALPHTYPLPQASQVLPRGPLGDVRCKGGVRRGTHSPYIF